MPFDLGSLNRTHGKSQTVEYKTWKRMRGRCFNKNDPKYPIYGLWTTGFLGGFVKVDKLIFGSVNLFGRDSESTLDKFGLDTTAPGYVFRLQAALFTEKYGTLEFPIREKTLDEILGVPNENGYK